MTRNSPKPYFEWFPTLADLIDGLDIPHDPDEPPANQPLRPAHTD